MFTLHLLLLLPLVAFSVHALGKLEPAEGKLLFGAWVDTSSIPISGGDSPGAFNDRIGFHASAFQFYQHLPLKPPVDGPPDYDVPNHNPDGSIKMSVLNDGTNAAMFLTIYPDRGLSEAVVTDNHIIALANQASTITETTGRHLYLRLAPEMNGDWFPYGQQPEAYIAFWKRFHRLFTPIAPEVALVWSPNFRAPNGKYLYDPYWPGEEYVDWVGVSIYWKGLANKYPWIENTLAPSNYAAQLLDADGPEGSTQSLYRDYAVKYNKPLVISESAAAFHMGHRGQALGEGIGQVATVMSFWNSFIFSAAFRSKYPLVKMVFCFEMVKTEDADTTNDYRATADPATLAEFRKGLAALDEAGVVLWAGSGEAPHPVTSGSVDALTSTAGSSTVGNVAVVVPVTAVSPSAAVSAGKASEKVVIASPSAAAVVGLQTKSGGLTVSAPLLVVGVLMAGWM
ncbi:hypothetical protein HDU80_005514 [Chytriomyces hyalinus]|nr:hypothetical protein HDU80_005514 [Chytriomyces hyalinus]